MNVLGLLEIFKTKDGKRMNVLIAINDAYCISALVMLNSFFKNNDGKHSIHLINSNLSLDNKNKIQSFVTKNSSELKVYNLSSDTFSEMPLNNHFTKEIYYRLLVQDIVSKEIDRILWLDADIVVNGNLSEFYFTDFNDNMIVACKAVSDTENINRLTLKKDTIYFNSGVILFNLTKIRKYVNYSVVFNLLEEKKDILLWPDQDALNILYEGKIVIENYCIYNMQVRNELIDRNSYNTLRNNSKIIHYVTADKPWNSHYRNMISNLYIKYLWEIDTVLALKTLTKQCLVRFKRSWINHEKKSRYRINL